MKLAIVGSTELEGNPDAAAIIEQVLDAYEPMLVISGAARGIDTMAVEAAKARGIDYKEYPAILPAWEYYKARNLLIAQECDCLVRIVWKWSKTYGSGWTRDRVKEMGKSTAEYVVE